MFKFSGRSIKNLMDVNEHLKDIAKKALEVTDVDFAVIEGLRTKERQQELVSEGKSKTLQSKHLIGHAIDVMAFVNSRGTWIDAYYYQIADAFKKASMQLDIPLRWGGAWNIPDIGSCPLSAEEMTAHYVKSRQDRGLTPFLDFGHFELGNLFDYAKTVE